MSPSRKSYFSTFELLLMTQFVALAVILKVVLRMPLRLPGKSGLFEIALLMVCCGLVPKFGAGLYMQTMTGIVLAMLGAGDAILYYTLPRWAARGLVADLLLLIPFDRWRPFGFAITGALAGAAKAAAGIGMLALLDPPQEVLAVGLGYGLLTHSTFGAVGGLLGERVLTALDRAGMDQYLAERA